MGSRDSCEEAREGDEVSKTPEGRNKRAAKEKFFQDVSFSARL